MECYNLLNPDYLADHINDWADMLTRISAEAPPSPLKEQAPPHPSSASHLHLLTDMGVQQDMDSQSDWRMPEMAWSFNPFLINEEQPNSFLQPMPSSPAFSQNPTQTPSQLFDLQLPHAHPPPSSKISPHTPLSSFSSYESEEEQPEQLGKATDEGQQRESKKRKAGKKEGQNQKGPRFAIRTRSMVDVIDDGYKWRKYGQKGVKNSPHPRSYYRCTESKCGAKKHVERDCDDDAYVVTTYEGVHTHPSPAPIDLPLLLPFFLSHPTPTLLH